MYKGANFLSFTLNKNLKIICLINLYFIFYIPQFRFRLLNT